MTKEFVDEFYPTGELKSRTYKKGEKIHRDPKEGPAIVHYREDGCKSSERYYVEGKLNRDPNEGPASTHYYTDGTENEEFYYLDGRLFCRGKVEQEKRKRALEALGQEDDGLMLRVLKDLLADEVRYQKGQEANEINNAGFEAQLKYLEE